MKKAIIREVRGYIIAPHEMGADYHNQHGAHWINELPIANPMSVYEEYKAKRTSWGINALGTVVVEVELDDGTVGVGCSIGGEPACYIIEQHLSRFVEGQDPRDVELIWDQMWRATLPYGRKGLAIQAISAVDLAIWDCLGKLRGEPVYALIGGKTKARLPIYATTSRPDIAREFARGLSQPLVVFGRTVEPLWEGVAIEARDKGPNWLDGIGAVLHPATLTHEPRPLLEARAHGIPIYATETCGLSPSDYRPLNQFRSE